MCGEHVYCGSQNAQRVRVDSIRFENVKRRRRTTFYRSLIDQKCAFGYQSPAEPFPSALRGAWVNLEPLVVYPLSPLAAPIHHRVEDARDWIR